MGKTVEQKLIGAKEEIRNNKNRIKELERQISSYKRQLDVRLAQVDKKRAEAKISEAKLKSAEMFICYLQSLACNSNEVIIPLKELYEFSTGHTVMWQMDDVRQEIVIRTSKRSEEGAKTDGNHS